jgi:hypothetical protein
LLSGSPWHNQVSHPNGQTIEKTQLISSWLTDTNWDQLKLKLKSDNLWRSGPQFGVINAKPMPNQTK